MLKPILISLISLFPILCFGQILGPMDLAKKLMSKEAFTDIDKFSTGEFDGHPNGQDLNGNPTITYKLLNQTSNTAVVNLSIKDSLNNGFDSYLHFKKDTIWKI
jgi:hypothetical protein